MATITFSELTDEKFGRISQKNSIRMGEGTHGASHHQMDVTHVLIKALIINTQELFENMDVNTPSFCGYLVVTEAHLKLTAECIKELHDVIENKAKQYEDGCEFWKRELDSFKKSYREYKSLLESRILKLRDPSPFYPGGRSESQAEQMRCEALQAILHNRSDASSSSDDDSLGIADLRDHGKHGSMKSGPKCRSSKRCVYTLWIIAVILTGIHVGFWLTTTLLL